MVGNSRTAGGESHAFLWDAEFGMTDLGTLGGSFSGARDINSLGQVVGFAERDDGSIRPFLWTAEAGMIDLGGLGGFEAEASRINENGEVAGRAQDPDRFRHAFLWSESTGLIDLGLADFVAGINDLGQVAGEENGIPFVARVLDDGTVERVELPGLEEGAGGTPTAINNLGQIVGTSFSSAGRRAVLWSPDGTIMDLGTLGGSSSRARDINDRGHVIGRSRTGEGGRHGFFWSPDLGMVDLGSLPDERADSSIAIALNDSNVVVGQSRADGPRAVVWEPVGLEEPTVQDDIADVIALIDSLVEEGRLATGIALSLESKLLTINDALQRGQNTAAGNLIEATIIQIVALSSAGQIDADAADALVAALQAIAV